MEKIYLVQNSQKYAIVACFSIERALELCEMCKKSNIQATFREVNLDTHGYEFKPLPAGPIPSELLKEY